MKIDDLLYKETEWLKGKGPRSGIVISSRVRLARNIAHNPFYNRASAADRQRILDEGLKAALSSKFFKDASFIRLKDISELDRQFLVERHLMSPEHTMHPEFKGLIMDEKEIVSVMINEEDHLRIQVLQSGLDLTEAWRIVDEIDTDLSEQAQYAFSSRWGYLTACPTNTGTGLRGSVMLHLPALAMTNQVGTIFQAISKLGLTMRGLYGEGTDATGDFYQISNQVTLGSSETDLLENINRIIKKIVMRENSTRNMLVTKNREELKDKIWRGLGTLKSARIISSQETITLLSLIRLGVYLGLVKDIAITTVNELFMLIQPAHLQKRERTALSANERDQKRTELIRSKLK